MHKPKSCKEYNDAIDGIKNLSRLKYVVVRSQGQTSPLQYLLYIAIVIEIENNDIL